MKRRPVNVTVEGREMYDLMRDLMRGAGYHLQPWEKLPNGERLSWFRLAQHAVVDQPSESRQ